MSASTYKLRIAAAVIRKQCRLSQESDDKCHGVRGESKGNRRSLGFPRFPVESCGFGQLHVVLFNENHISGTGESGEVGNPGTLLMTKRRMGVSSGNWFEGSQVSKARPGAPFGFTLRCCRGHKLCHPEGPTCLRQVKNGMNG